MKKIFVLFLAVFIMAMFSISAFAADAYITCGSPQSSQSSGDKLHLGTSGGNCTGEIGISMNVVAAYCSGGNSYAAITHNPKGKIVSYGTASDTSNIYYTASDKTSTLTGVINNASAAGFYATPWEKLGK
jgi:hypothetical protein